MTLPGEIRAAQSPPAELIVVEVRTTFSSRGAAEACAARLVADRVAACVQVEGPIASTYRWQGDVERAEEFRCTCKTSPERMHECIAAIERDHPYETPEILVATLSASAAYAAWVRASVVAQGREMP
jgi:periplasmic divalent cation tolerance protein